MRTKEQRNEYDRARRERLIAAGLCKDCALPREGESCTRTYCQTCADKRRAAQRARNGTPLDAPVQRQVHARQTDVILGSLTRAEVRRAVTTLPLKPPGK